MLVFSITVLVVVALLILDRFYPKLTESPKYTNLDWEILTDREYYSTIYKGRIYSVVKNRIVIVYTTRSFYRESEAEEFTRKIYRTMRAEYGLVDEPVDSRTRNNYLNANIIASLRR